MIGVKQFGAAALILGIVAIVGVFMAWFWGYTGWEFLYYFNDENWNKQCLIVVVLIAGAISAIVGLLSLVGLETRIYCLIVLLAGIASLVAPIVWYILGAGPSISEVINDFKPEVGMLMSMMSGFLLAIIGFVGLQSDIED